jgi:phosphoglycolate phosphatase
MVVAASALAEGEDGMKDAVLLDLDGTLSDSRPGIEGCMRAAMAELGHPLDPAENLDWAIGPPTEDVFTRLLAPFGGGPIADCVAVYRKHYAAGGWSDNTPYPGIAAALASLGAAGYPMYLATSKRVDFARMILEHFDFARHFTAIHGAEMDGSRSHKPEMIAHIVASYGLDPKRCVMIGDRAFDIAGAHANGMRGLGVLWGYGSEAEFDQAGADGVIAAPSGILAAVQSVLG